MTYGDAVSAIEEDGGTAKIAVTVGDRQDAMGDCLVTNATDAPFVRDSEGEFGHADGEVLLTLNCNRGAATAPCLAPRQPARRAGISGQGRGSRRGRSRARKTNSQKPARPPARRRLKSRPGS